MCVHAIGITVAVYISVLTCSLRVVIFCLLACYNLKYHIYMTLDDFSCSYCCQKNFPMGTIKLYCNCVVLNSKHVVTVRQARSYSNLSLSLFLSLVSLCQWQKNWLIVIVVIYETKKIHCFLNFHLCQTLSPPFYSHSQQQVATAGQCTEEELQGSRPRSICVIYTCRPTVKCSTRCGVCSWYWVWISMCVQCYVRVCLKACFEYCCRPNCCVFCC